MGVRKSVNFDEHALELVEEYRRNFSGKIPSFSKAVNDIIIAALTQDTDHEG